VALGQAYDCHKEKEDTMDSLGKWCLASNGMLSFTCKECGTNIRTEKHCI
jgi:hypothetical protein